jgi:membrane protease subunit (stomatin/prohibitin family)
MSLRDFLSKQFIDVIDWVEPEDGILAYRYPMQDREIQNGGKLTVRDSQMAVFVNEGRVADAFPPGLYTLNTQTLPILTYLENWDKAFQSPFKSDVYFFSTRIQVNQRWGTENPITIRDKEFGAVRLRAFGIYTYHIVDPKVFYSKVSGTRDLYRVEDLEGQLRNTIVGRISDTFAGSNVPFLDMAANQVALSDKIASQLKPGFTDLGLALDGFVVENLSLPDELQKVLDQRISMNMVGDMGRYTQYQVAQSIPVAAANEGGGAAGVGAGLGAGIAMGQAMMDALKKSNATGESGSAPAVGGAATAAAETKFCLNCGKPIPKVSKFCPECGQAQP